MTGSSRRPTPAPTKSIHTGTSAADRCPWIWRYVRPSCGADPKKSPEISTRTAHRGYSLTIDHGWQEVAQAALDFVKRFDPAKPS
jgi:hypothetical protein